MGCGDDRLPAGPLRRGGVHSLLDGEPGDEGGAAAVSRPSPTSSLLRIDPDLLESDVRLENLDGGDELFPHIYGDLDLSAVTGLEALIIGADGEFVTPTLLVPARFATPGTAVALMTTHA